MTRSVMILIALWAGIGGPYFVAGALTRFEGPGAAVALLGAIAWHTFLGYALGRPER